MGNGRLKQKSELNAFEKYLLQLPLDQAIEHVIFCLMQGEAGNEAWALMGDFKVSSVPELREVVANRLQNLRTKV